MPRAQASFETLDLSDRLRLLMSAHKLTISEMAEKAGVSKSAMEKYLAGPSSPRATAIASICSALNVDADWLLLGRESDLFTLQSLAFGEIFTLLEDLKRDGKLSDEFHRLDLGSLAWREFARELGLARAVELRNTFDKRRQHDAEIGLERQFGAKIGIYTDVETGKLVGDDTVNR